MDAVPRYESLSILRVAGSIVRTEGPLGLFKGLVPSVMKAAPSSAVTFFVYAQCQRLFLERREAMAR